MTQTLILKISCLSFGNFFMFWLLYMFSKKISSLVSSQHIYGIFYSFVSITRRKLIACTCLKNTWILYHMQGSLWPVWEGAVLFKSISEWPIQILWKGPFGPYFILSLTFLNKMQIYWKTMSLFLKNKGPLVLPNLSLN